MESFNNSKFQPNEHRTNKPISSKSTKGNQTGNLAAASAIARKIAGEGGTIEEAYITTKIEDQALTRFAKEHNLWVDDYRKEFGEMIGKGVEAEVFASKDGRSVIKVNNGDHHPCWDDFFARILAHNKYFPETLYELFGMCLRDGRMAVILKQPAIAIERSAEPGEIRDDLVKRGFIFHHIHEAIDIEGGVILRDLHQENAVLDSAGNVVYIDPLIQFIKKSESKEDF